MPDFIFDETELTVTGTRPGAWKNMPECRVYGKRPITGRENMRRYYQRRPMWMPMFRDTTSFSPTVVPDNVARGFIFGGETFDPVTQGGGKDMFGIEWVYVPQVGGSMVKPGNPALEDVNDWKKVIRLPDVAAWDWAGSRRANEAFVQEHKDDWLVFTLLSGAWFERLISFMDFEGAAMALIDEEQQDAVHELFTATTQVMMDIVDKAVETFPEICSFNVHDDWGSQAAPFFSQRTAMEMIVPHMKTLVDHIHSKGCIADMHSCGHSEDRIEAYIAAGWDSWCPQPMNDHAALFQNYGDRIIIEKSITGMEPMDDARQKALAHELAETFVVKGKPSRIMMWGGGVPALEEELYRISRTAYAE